jgi:Flp pilus assembly protein TadG
MSAERAVTSWPCARLMRRFGASRQGMAMVEFGLMLPVLMVLFYGMVEVTRYILITQKVEKLAHSVADMTSQSQTTTLSALNQVMAAASDIMNPYSLSSNGRIIISSLYREPNTVNAKVNWRHEGGGTLIATSQLGALGATPAMPGGFTFDERENVISAEVFYQFSPLLTNRFFGTKTIYRAAFYKPRFGALLSAPA